MKTQTFGVFVNTLMQPRPYPGPPPRGDYSDVQWWHAQAVQEYRKNRENGTDSDNPNWQFPQDGKFTWLKGTLKDDGYVYGIKESDGYFHYEIEYKQGVGDARFFGEKDALFISRLEKDGLLEKQEPEEFKKRQEEARRREEEQKRIETERKKAEEKKLIEALQLPSFTITETSSEKQLVLLSRLKGNACVNALSMQGLALCGNVRNELVCLLTTNKTLKSLNLTDCKISDEDIQPFIGVLKSKQNTTLVEMKLDGNEIKRNHLAEINSYLKRNAVLFGEKSSGAPSSDIEIPKNYECPITSLVMLDPVFTSDGETYEREAIQEWLTTKNTSPTTNEPLEHKGLTANRSLKSLIGVFLEKHPELWRRDAIYVSEVLKRDLLSAVAMGNLNDIRRFVEMDKRMLWLHLTGTDTLLELACKQRNPKVLDAVVNLLSNSVFGDLFWEQLWDGVGIGCFRLSAMTMGVDGASIISKKLDWVQMNFQEELFAAMQVGNVELARVCLSLGARLDTKDNSGDYSVHLTIVHDQLGALKFLIAQKANLELVNSNGDTPLLLGVRKNASAMVGALILAKANINAVDKQGNTALLIAVQKGSFDIFTDLISAGADVEAQDTEGNTPLHIAAQLGNHEMVEALMKAGANPKAKNNQQQKPAAVAKAAGKPKTAMFIEALDFRLKLQPMLEPMQKRILLLEEEIKLLKDPSLPREKEKAQDQSTEEEEKKPTGKTKPSMSELLAKFGSANTNISSVPSKEHKESNQEKKGKSDLDPTPN